MENTSLYHRLLLSIPARFSPSFPPCTSLLAVFSPCLFLFRLLFLAEAISLSLSVLPRDTLSSSSFFLLLLPRDSYISVQSARVGLKPSVMIITSGVVTSEAGATTAGNGHR